MTPRAPQASRPAPEAVRPAPGRSGEPRRRGGPGPILAPIVALVGLVLVAGGSFWTVSVFGLTDEAVPTERPVANLTPDASGVVPTADVPSAEPTARSTVLITPPPDQKASIVGTILFTKQGNVFAATGTDAPRPLTRNAKTWDSAPTWMPNGQRIVYVETRERQVQAPNGGKLTKFLFQYPNIASVDANGKDRKLIHEGIFPKAGGFWHRWVLQPDVSPDGSTIALVSDGTDGLGDVVLSTMNIRGNQLRTLDVKSLDGMGHNDPAWSPDGKRIAYTFNSASGRLQIGTPKIVILTLKSGEEHPLRQGYANPSWSPDGTYLAAERTSGFGRDIVILDTVRGAELARLTNDGRSFAPTFSPNGDQIAYLKRDGLKVDLWIMTLDPSRGFERIDDKAVTADGGLDAESPPSWYIPPEQLVVQSTPEPVIDESVESPAP